MSQRETAADLIEVRTTLPTEEAAHDLALNVVGRRLAACAQVLGPMTSIYWWSGTVENESEWLVLLKTRADAFAALAVAVREQHPYDTPELLAVPITRGDADYAAWVRAEVRPE